MADSQRKPARALPIWFLIMCVVVWCLYINLAIAHFADEAEFERANGVSLPRALWIATRAIDAIGVAIPPAILGAMVFRRRWSSVRFAMAGVVVQFVVLRLVTALVDWLVVGIAPGQVIAISALSIGLGAFFAASGCAYLRWSKRVAAIYPRSG